MKDIIAYSGTALLLIAPLLTRTNLHLFRIAGNTLWMIYGILIDNMPVALTEAIMTIMEIIGLIKYHREIK